MALLELRNVFSFYGNLEALHGISLQVHEGEIVSLIGANGAGKTTTLRTITNLIQSRQGDIHYAGRETRNMAVHEMASAGMALVPEGRRIFAKLSVRENLQMGAFRRTDPDGIAEDVAYVENLFPRLKERVSQIAGTLSGGEQQMLAIARALMSRPKLLLLDEPSMGLAPVLVDQIFTTLEDISARGMTILLVEQNARRALALADRGYVLETGSIVLEGTSGELLENPQVSAAYLGG